jgi:hypothetical protein
MLRGRLSVHRNARLLTIPETRGLRTWSDRRIAPVSGRRSDPGVLLRCHARRLETSSQCFLVPEVEKGRVRAFQPNLWYTLIRFKHSTHF